MTTATATANQVSLQQMISVLEENGYTPILREGEAFTLDRRPLALDRADSFDNPAHVLMTYATLQSDGVTVTEVEEYHSFKSLCEALAESVDETLQPLEILGSVLSDFAPHNFYADWLCEELEKKNPRCKWLPIEG